jgi:uncharacterized protein involved in exopolysaccharide biosynthesis
MDNMYLEAEENSKSLADYLAAIKRRRKLMVVSASITLAIMVAIALLWPATYRSSATILIEEQEIPQDLVRSTVTSYAVQQIEVIKQRIILFSEREMARMARTEIAEEFQDAVGLDLINAQIIDPKTGRPGEATIAFNLSFDHKSASLAQKVVNELTTLYLNENLRTRTQKTESASAFLESEAELLNKKLVELETELAEFKKANEGSLPELYQYNVSTIERTERELMEISLRIDQLEKNKIRLASDLAQLSPSAPVVLASGEAVLSEVDRLKAAQSEYRRKSAMYHEDHPDVVRLKREVEALLETLGPVEGSKELKKELQTAKDHLASLQDRYTSDHPDVQAQQRVVSEIETKLVDNVVKNPDVIADNPSYVLLETQLKGADAEINGLRTQQQQLRDKVAHYEGLILRAPEVERDYKVLLRDYENAQFRYRETRAKQMEAAVAQNLEEERKGQRFTLIGPPILPEEPVSPNRPAILVIGVILAGGVAVGVMLLVEALDQSIRGVRALTAATGFAPLVTLPYLPLDEEIEAKSSEYKKWLIGLIIAGIAFVIAVHFLYKPLDVLWYVVTRKLGIG